MFSEMADKLLLLFKKLEIKNQYLSKVEKIRDKDDFRSSFIKMSTLSFYICCVAVAARKLKVC